MGNKSRTIVLGLGVSGIAAVKLLLHLGKQVLGIDRDPSKRRASLGLSVQDEETPIDYSTIDQIVLSPGIPETHPIVQKGLEHGIEVIGEIELACRNARQKMIGITGTNGKTTVTLLTAHILRHAGKKARASGNVGTPLSTDILESSPDEILVVELSSYQLETLKAKAFEDGVILNITPDHLDRYASMEEYAKAKCNLQRCLKGDGSLWVEFKTLEEFGHLLHPGNIKTYGFDPKSTLFSNGKHIFWESKMAWAIPENLQKFKGHDVENLMASFGLCSRLGITPYQFAKGLQTFKKPSHRIEYIGTFNGVSYFDDSKGTNIDAVVKAVETMPGPVVLIAGGVDKGAPYTPWIPVFQGKVRAIIALGQAAGNIHKDLSQSFDVILVKDMDEAIEEAKKLAIEGDCVLLSPGCSSYDMFRDYAHRGEVFQNLVKGVLQ